MEIETIEKQNIEKNVEKDVIDLDGEKDCDTKFTSWVWDHFEKPKKKPYPNKINCPYCKQAFKFDPRKN